MVSQTGDYLNLRDVIWMGTETSGRSYRMLEDGGGMQVDLRGFSALITPLETEKWNNFESRFFSITSQYANYYSGSVYDAAWLAALSIIESGSMDANEVVSVLLEIGANYEGVTGYLIFDENGDRIPNHFDIWGARATRLNPYLSKTGVCLMLYLILWRMAKPQCQAEQLSSMLKASHRLPFSQTQVTSITLKKDLEPCWKNSPKTPQWDEGLVLCYMEMTTK